MRKVRMLSGRYAGLTAVQEDHEAEANVTGGLARWADGENDGPQATDDPIPDATERKSPAVPDAKPDAPEQPGDPAGNESEDDETLADAPAALALHHRGGGRYDVLDTAGHAVNERPLTRVQAEDLIDDLTAGRE